MITKLRGSLVRVLSKFPPLTGRLDPRDLWCVCNNHGVGFVVKNQPGSVREIASFNRLQFQEFPNADGVLKGTQPLMSITVHVFEEGGWILAVNINHSICDGHSFAMFMSAWSKMHNGMTLQFDPTFTKPWGEMTEKNFELAMRENGCVAQPFLSWFTFWYNSLHVLIRSHIPKFFLFHLMRPYQQNEQLVIKFRPEQIDYLKSIVKSRMQDIYHPDGWVSTNEVLSAYVHKRILDLLVVPEFVRKNLGQVQVVDCRDRVKGVTKTYFGNATIGNHVGLNFSGKKWPDVVINLHDQMRVKLNDASYLVNSLRGYEYAMSRSWIYLPKKWKTAPFVLDSWNSQMNIDFCDVDFGLGRPNQIINCAVRGRSDQGPGAKMLFAFPVIFVGVLTMGVAPWCCAFSN